MALVPKYDEAPPLESSSNTAQMVEEAEDIEQTVFFEPSEAQKELIDFVVDHTDRWRDYRDQNYQSDWEKQERIFYGQWKEDDKTRSSERSRVVSPATQQAVETRHAEIIEAIFGQGEFFDIDDDIEDQNGALDVEMLKKKLMEDFAQDKVRKAFDQIVLLGEIYDIGIGEITVSTEKRYVPMEVPLGNNQVAYGSGEKERVSVKLVPVNPKNFLFDPNGVSIDDCMGVAIEKYVSIHKIAQGIADGKYFNVDIGSFYKDDSNEATQEAKNYEDDKVLLLTYYGLVPREYLSSGEEIDNPAEDQVADEIEDYSDLVEAIVVIANGCELLKAVESPYTMKDRPVLSYQPDTVPNRLIGRGGVRKAYNMQVSIDGSIRSHMDSLALTNAPMMGMDATRLPRGAKFEVKPGKSFMTNGNPNEILMPFKFGTTDGQAMQTAKEFERMLLMATATIDSNGMPSNVSRDAGGLDMATATLIKKYKRTLTNFQEDFLIPFIYKAAWRYMQYDPERYPSVDVRFIPTATLGIIAREYEQKQLAFLIQTLGANSPLTPILMQSVVKNSSLSNREEMLAQLQQASQPNPQQQQVQMMEAEKIKSEIDKTKAETQQIVTETQLEPQIAQAKVISALTNNLNEDNEDRSFQQRVQMSELLLKEQDIKSNERIAAMQVAAKRQGNMQ